MKLIKLLILICVLSIITLIIAINYNSITDFFNETILEIEKETLESSNTYKKNYDFMKFKLSDNFIPQKKEDLLNIYFNILNNGWNKFTFYCPENYKTCVEDISELSSDKTTLSNINNYVSPFNSFKSIDTSISSLGEINVNVKKNYTKEEIKDINTKINETIVLLDLKNLNSRDKLLKIHNYIATNSVYDKERAENKTSKYDSDKAYGPLFEGYSVCSGYSDLFALFLDRLNIPNLKISTENHIWNLVYIEGKWLHVDLTWDDHDSTSSFKTYFFLIDTNKLLELDTNEHNFNKDFFIEAS